MSTTLKHLGETGVIGERTTLYGRRFYVSTEGSLGKFLPYLQVEVIDVNGVSACHVVVQIIKNSDGLQMTSTSARGDCAHADKMARSFLRNLGIESAELKELIDLVVEYARQKGLYDQRVKELLSSGPLIGWIHFQPKT